MTLLEAILGPVAAAAVEAGVRTSPGLAAAVLPRAALAWARVALRRGADGPLPGSDATVLVKGEAWAITTAGSPAALSGTGDAGLAAAVLVLAGAPAVAPDAPAPALLRLGRSLDHLAGAAFAKAEPVVLEKRSKNVKEQTTNITPEQADARRTKYSQSLGLNPVKVDASSIKGFPRASRTKIPVGGTFDVAHETAHAMMTPPGKTVRQYMDQVTSDGRKPSERFDTSSNAGFEAFQEAWPVHAESVGDENTAQALEYKIDRRAGVNPHKFQQVAPEGPGGGKPFRQVVVTPDDNSQNWYEYSDEDRAADPSLPQKAKTDDELRNEARARAPEYAARFDAGARFNGQGKVVPPSGIDARINAGAGGVAGIKARLARGRFGKAEDLTKRSKNVREQTRNITPLQAIQRRVRYAQSIGLKPVGAFGGAGFPAARGNKVPFGDNFGVEHETAHAMMTPDGQTIRQYQRHLTHHGDEDRAQRVYDRESEWGGDYPEHEEAVYHENVANQLEHRIDRRAGVGGHASDFRDEVKNNANMPDGDEFNYQDEPSERGYGTPVPSQAFKDDANHYAAKLDAGARFNAKGRIDPPKGVDAKINTGTAGVAGLKARMNKAEALTKARGREGAGPAHAPQAPGAPTAAAAPATGTKPPPMAKPAATPGTKPPAAGGHTVAAAGPKTAIPTLPKVGVTKSEDLEKRSKNVREQTRNITPEQREARVDGYVRRLGFRARAGRGDKFGVGKDQKELVYSQIGSPMHEMGHALMTPPGQTLRERQNQIGAPSTAPTKKPFGAQASWDDEGAAYMMEPPLYRRAGVGVPDNAYKDNQTSTYISSPPGTKPERGVDRYPRMRANAVKELGAVETGQKVIGPRGDVTEGTHVDAKINAGTAGVAGLKARLGKKRA